MRRVVLRAAFAAFAAWAVGLAVGGMALDSAKHRAQAIRTYMSRLEGFGFSGSLLVGKDGKVVTQSVHGLADRQRKIPVGTDTIFDIGSLTKQFTAAAILALESDGKLSVQDPIAKYLKTVPEDKTGITIHHLLTHTSGLEMDFGSDYEKVSREEIVRRALASELLRSPGERHAYSNAGYSLLAAIVEIVSGRSYETYLRERLFRPAQMASCGYFFLEAKARLLARGYKDGEDWGIGAEKAAATGGDFWNLIGNGGVHSTVGDLYKWMAALEQGKVLTAEARRKLFHPHVVVSSNWKGSNSVLYYAYGWYVWKQPSGKTLIFHLGGNNVFNAAIRAHVDDRTVVIYASNVSEFHDPSYPVPAIERLLAGETVPMPPQVTPLAPGQVAGHAGRYHGASGAALAVEAKSPFLTLQGEGQEAFAFIVRGRWQKDAASETLNARTAEAVENSRTRQYEALRKAYGPETTLESLAEDETAFWRKRHAAYGAYVKTRVLGTMPSRSARYAGTTIVAVDFERGTAYREYLWTPEGTIGDLGPILSPPAKRFFPVSVSCFASFDPAAAESSRICFEKAAADGADGVVATIPQGAERVQLRHSR